MRKDFANRTNTRLRINLAKRERNIASDTQAPGSFSSGTP
jgi:hypothetical protein